MDIQTAIELIDIETQRHRELKNRIKGDIKTLLELVPDDCCTNFLSPAVGNGHCHSASSGEVRGIRRSGYSSSPSVPLNQCRKRTNLQHSHLNPT